MRGRVTKQGKKMTSIVGKFKNLHIEPAKDPKGDFNSRVTFEAITGDVQGWSPEDRTASGVALITDKNKESFCAHITKLGDEPYSKGVTVYLDGEDFGRTL